jgi:hypothetical protein
VTELVGSTGTIASQYTYDPYGNQTTVRGTASDIGYAGYFNTPRAVSILPSIAPTILVMHDGSIVSVCRGPIPSDGRVCYFFRRRWISGRTSSVTTPQLDPNQKGPDLKLENLTDDELTILETLLAKASPDAPPNPTRGDGEPKLLTMSSETEAELPPSEAPPR